MVIDELSVGQMRELLLIAVVVPLPLLGVGAHLANGIPDIDTDRATDSHGLLGRLGGQISANLAGVAR